MYSFFFGSSDRKLYGALESTDSGRFGVLICGSWGPEAQASHRFLRVISKRLTGAGLSTMRFDYRGSGDSYGEARNVTLASMLADTQSAIDEFREMQSVDPLCLIGYRLGAVPALSAAREAKCTVVLLDPVLDGPRWLRELETDRCAARLDDGALETGGFIVGPELGEALVQDSPLIDPVDGPEVVAVVVSSGSDCAGFPAAKVATCASGPTWSLDDGVGSATVSPRLVDTVVERIVGLGSAQL